MPSRTRTFDCTKYMVYIILAITLLLFAVWLGKSFFSFNNMLNVLRQTAMISIMAVAMTFVIGSGNIDLSIGGIVALSSLVCALCMRSTDSILLSVAATLAVGAAVGAVNGVLITTFHIPAFLLTMGMLNICKGMAMALTNTKAIPIMNPTFNSMFGLYDIGGVVPILLIWTLAALAVGHFLLAWRPFGRKALAIGGNAASARYSGINVKSAVIQVMALSGLAASFAGVLYSGRMQTARYTYGDGVELSVIAATVIGGTSMAGGTGSIIGAFIGSFLLGVINNGLIIGGLTVAQQMMVRGALIIIAVALNYLGDMRKERE